MEIGFQRLIGRALRSVTDLERLGERTVTVDCDVLVADAGTRTASITGGYIALALALRQCGRGAMEVITDFGDPEAVFAGLRRLVERSGRPLSFSLIEGVRGRAVAREVYERVSVVGIALVLLLFVIGLSNDIGHLS